MFSGENPSHFNPRNTAIWLSLAFQAGVINTGGYLACHRFVTHMTGFATLFGTEVSLGSWFSAFGILSVPMFFLAGSMLSAFLIDQRKLHNKRPHYPVVMFLMAAMMVGVTIGGVLGYFGHFGEELALVRDYALLAVLCLTSGIQNATVTSAYGSVVRTTHLTGLTTDLGIGLVRILTGAYKRAKDDEIKSTWMRLGIISAFTLGSFSAFIFVHAHYWGFALPAVISSVLFYLSVRTPTRKAREAK